MPKSAASTRDALSGDCFITIAIGAQFDPAVKRWVAGSPQLDVWSSGDDEPMARVRATEAITLFLNETEKLGTLPEILEQSKIKVYPTHHKPGFFERLTYSLKGTSPLVLPVPHLSYANC